MVDQIITMFFDTTTTTEIYPYLHTHSHHDSLPICPCSVGCKKLAHAGGMRDLLHAQIGRDPLAEFAAPAVDPFSDRYREAALAIEGLGRRQRAVQPAPQQPFAAAPPDLHQIGRASCRERVCQYVSLSVVAGAIKNKHTIDITTNI